MTDYKILFRLYRAYLIALAAAAFAALLGYWLFRGYGGRQQVGEKITEMQTAAKQNERRIDAILDGAKEKEVTARNETLEQTAAVSDDGLPDLLAGLLADYRAKR